MAILLRLDRIPVFVVTITLLMATVIQRRNRILVLLMTQAANARQSRVDHIGGWFDARVGFEGGQSRGPQYLVASSNVVSYQRPRYHTTTINFLVTLLQRS